ncbi:MAG: hypothetical protein J6Q96_02875 [Bacteroidales bacterium]|nr:hypothetical protein [Bacteroidales bacterium]
MIFKEKKIMLYEGDIRHEYLDRLKKQARIIEETATVLDYIDNREALTDKQVDSIIAFVSYLENIKRNLLDMC